MKLLLALAFVALLSVALAQWYPGQAVLTGVGEIAQVGHSKIAYQGYSNPSLNPRGYALNALPYAYNLRG